MLLDPARLDRPDVLVASAPFAFLVAPRQLPDAQRDALAADFPRYGCAGFFPYRAQDCGDSVRALVAEMISPAVADAIGARLGLERLSERPAIVTLSDAVHLRHGTIHTDSKSKIATALLYLNLDWPQASEGCLRLLHRGDDIQALAAPEIRPEYGTLVAFRRADNSWHGHLPFEGERRVVQVAWLTSAGELSRKQRRGRFSRWVKKIAGALDARWGARRGINARHD
ncbi:2OG-Fe(II) oxygenase [Luteimonas aquatica]|uniref:2OG-Fe(II) oxygenase n=1 Tax=Luteimonas aquatica TaxID=450364 RepID=UPI001F598E57|nr:2OG-Fe(II) oxygenase [Luteimonas aquatica]